MNANYRTRLLTLLQLLGSLLAITILLTACGQTAAPAAPTSSAPTSAPATTAVPTTPAVAPSPTTAPTVAPSLTKAPTLAPSPTPAPTQPPAAVSGGDLSVAEMRAIFEASFAAYPWRWKQTVVIKETKQTIEGRLEAQSGTRVHTVTPLGEQNAVIESILISPTLYLKATGVPPEKLKEFGATEGQWYKVPPSFASAVYLAGNPPKLLESLGFGEELKRLEAGGKPYKLTGTEMVGGTQTNVYELVISGVTGSFTHRISVGASDRRIYKMVSDGPLQTATTVVEYDPSIKIDPPVP
jgi:hypothetical protein